jgi:hypothetical protein
VSAVTLPSLHLITGLLPPGEHDATLDEVETRFATNRQRRKIFVGLRFVVEGLRAQGVKDIYVDGSFVTAKERPNDAEVVFIVPEGANTRSWGLLAWHRHDDLKRQKLIDLWPWPAPQRVPGRALQLQTILDFFLTDRSGTPKGVIHLLEKGPTPDDPKSTAT